MERGDEESGDLCASVRSMGTPCLSCLLCVFVVVPAFLIFQSVRVVPPANLGLVVIFGRTAEQPLSAGMNLCNPFASISLFSLRTTLLEQHNIVPTKEGVNVDLDVAIVYHVEKDKVRDIFLQIGANYEDVLIAPELASSVRGLTSKGKAEALYNNSRKVLQEQLKASMEKQLKPRGIILENVLLKGIVLPPVLKDSIETKARMEQEADRMVYVLQKETQEATRKSIEADGIAAFQDIVSKGISTQLLQWKGIEATEKFSESRNSKIVIVGNSKDSLPVIMNGE